MKREKSFENVMLLALMLKGRKCVVVGGGKTGYRKVEALLEAEGDVVVIAPEAVSGLSESALEGRIEWRQREFLEEDLDEVFIAFAATDCDEVNRFVLKSGRRRGVLCGIVDRGWRGGDFISPALVKHDGLNIGISTGGRSCRRARMVKDSLSRHIDAISSTDILVLGVDHRSLTLDQREALHFDEAKKHQLSSMFSQISSLHGYVFIETCNRVEIHAAVSNSGSAAIESILKRLLGFEVLAADDVYCKTGFEAFSHAALLLAGLFSQVPGEKHIVSQVKTAFEEAFDRAWSNALLTEWLSSALHVSKHIRGQTQALLPQFELEDACLSFLEQRHGADAAEFDIMVIGAGAMGRALVERALTRHPQLQVWWIYRENKPSLSEKGNKKIKLFKADDIQHCLKYVQAVVCAADSEQPLFNEGSGALFNGLGPISIIDLGVPRNVDASLSEIVPGVELFNLDDLKSWYKYELGHVSKALGEARKMVEEHRFLYQKIIDSAL